MKNNKEYYHFCITDKFEYNCTGRKYLQPANGCYGQIKSQVEYKNNRKEIAVLRKENQLLKNGNERMKRILNNDNTNSNMSPSTEQTGKFQIPEKYKADVSYGDNIKAIAAFLYNVVLLLIEIIMPV